MPEETFVGRERYIRQFEQLLSDPSSKQFILNLRGPGGIGKTKILQKFVEICEEIGYPHSGIIDFYSSELNSRIRAVEQNIAAHENDAFAKYWQLYQRSEEVPNLILEQESRKQFIVDLSTWTNQITTTGKKAVLIFDTFEAVKDNPVGARLLNEWLPELKSAVVILSGRQEEGEIVFLPGLAELVVDAPVSVFTTEEATDYLKERGVWQAIQDDSVEDTLFELTGKSPLLLALSADWIVENISFDVKSPANLVEGASKDDFERKLVQDLPNVIRYPERVVLPYMAHIPRPVDIELIEFLTPDIPDKGITILENLSQLSFVKAHQEEDKVYYWFQDELRVLFHKYVFLDSVTWDPVRQDVSRRMIEFYTFQINKARENYDIHTEQRYIAARFYHEAYLDPTTAFRKRFEDQFRRAHQFGVAGDLLAEMRIFVDLLDEELQYTFKLSEIRWLRDIGEGELARRRGLELLDKHIDQPERAVYIYNALGGIAERLGELFEALEYYGTSLELSKRLGLDERFSVEETNIGRIYRTIGEWEKARDHFRRAYDYAGVIKPDPNPNEIARSLSELGYTLGLLKEHEVGIGYCSQAIQVCERFNLSQQAARGKVLRGVIHRFAEAYEEAVQDFQEAVETFSQANYAIGLAQTHFHLGLTHWFQSSKVGGDTSLLNQAQNHLENSIRISREHNLIGELPRALSELSRVYWIQGKREEARKLNKEAYQLSQTVHDVYYTIDSLLALAEYDYDEGKYEAIPEYADELKREFEGKYKFSLFYGRMRNILGSISFKQGRQDDAVKYYAEGLSLIAQHGSRWRMERELKRLEKDLQDLVAELELKSYEGLREYWIKNEQTSNMLKLVSWVDQRILSFQLRSK